MTYKEIYEQFLTTSGGARNINIADYRPAKKPYVDFELENAIVVYLKDGNRLIYIADVEVKGYAYFKDERKEHEVITEYRIIDDDCVEFRTKSGLYVYYVTHNKLTWDDNKTAKVKIEQFGKVEETVTYELYCSGEIKADYNEVVSPCDIEMIHLLDSHRIERCGHTYY